MTTNESKSCCRPDDKGHSALGDPRVVAAFKALGDRNRLAMFNLIAEKDDVCSCEIEPRFELSQPTISHHLKLLREAGLVTSEKKGTWIHYRVNREFVRTLREVLLLPETCCS